MWTYPIWLLRDPLCSWELAHFVLLFAPKCRTFDGSRRNRKAWTLNSGREIGENETLAAVLALQCRRTYILCTSRLLEDLNTATPGLRVHYRTNVGINSWNTIPRITTTVLKCPPLFIGSLWRSKASSARCWPVILIVHGGEAVHWRRHCWRGCWGWRGWKIFCKNACSFGPVSIAFPGEDGLGGFRGFWLRLGHLVPHVLGWFRIRDWRLEKFVAVAEGVRGAGEVCSFRL